jgi:hypothetical protein
MASTLNDEKFKRCAKRRQMLFRVAFVINLIITFSLMFFIGIMSVLIFAVPFVFAFILLISCYSFNRCPKCNNWRKVTFLLLDHWDKDLFYSPPSPYFMTCSNCGLKLKNE